MLGLELCFGHGRFQVLDLPVGEERTEHFPPLGQPECVAHGHRLGGDCGGADQSRLVRQLGHVSHLPETDHGLFCRQLLLVERVEVDGVEQIRRSEHFGHRQGPRASRVGLTRIGKAPAGIEGAAHRRDGNATQERLEAGLRRDGVNAVDRLEGLRKRDVLDDLAKVGNCRRRRERLAMSVQHIGVRLVDDLRTRILSRCDRDEIVVRETPAAPQLNGGVVFHLTDYQNTRTGLRPVDLLDVDGLGLVVLAQTR